MRDRDVLDFLANNWFNDRKELRKARNLLLKYFPERRDFPLKYLFYECNEGCINADDLKQFIE